MNDNPTLQIGRPRGRVGRPRIGAGPATPVTTWVPTAVHDELIRRAQQRSDRSVSAVMREAVIRDLRRKGMGR